MLNRQVFELKHSKRTGTVIFDNEVNHDFDRPKVDRKRKNSIFWWPENTLLNIMGSYIIVSHGGAKIYQRLKSREGFTTESLTDVLLMTGEMSEVNLW